MRLRREPDPGPEVLRNLAALDAALAGEPLAPEDDDLRMLAVALREERPQLTPEFELALDLRVHESFRHESSLGIHNAAPERRKELHTPHRLRTTPLALGTAAAIFIVATAALTTGLLGTGDGGSDDAGRPQPALELEDSAPSSPLPAAGGDASSREVAPAPPQPQLLSKGGTAPRASDRQVERAAELTLSTPRNRIEDVADGAIRVTDRHGGFVLSSNVTSGANAGAVLDLRIPGERLQQAVADLSELAHVRARTQSARDITGEFTSPRRRLADALAERRSLLRRLEQATTPNETAAIRARLRAVNRRADRAQAQLRRLRERVGFAAVAVTVRPGADGSEDGGWSLGDAASDALSVLRAIAGGTIVALAVLVPAGIVAAIVWLAYRAAIRRRREHALDAPPVTRSAAPAD